MKLKFSWERVAGRVIPCCSSSVVNNGGVSPLACLLMDDGGLDCLRITSWLDEGLKKIDTVVRGEIPLESWDRDAWGASLKPDKVVVYSLYDENCCEVISPSRFRRALMAWREFMKATPDTSVVLEIEV